MPTPETNNPPTPPIVPVVSPVTPVMATRRRRWPLIVGGLFALLIVFSGVGFVTASTLEDHDSFCVACHTIPESTYYNRAYIALDHAEVPITDLATAHYHLSQKDKKTAFACIDCHRGSSNLPDRVAAIALGARDSVTFVAGHEDPTLAKTETREGWLSNVACVGCHTDTLLNVKGLNNHFHTKLPQVVDLLAKGDKITIDSSFTGGAEAAKEWSSPVANAPLVCTSCHLAHTTLPNGMNSFFMDNQLRNAACISCHKVVGKGPQNAADLGS